MASARSIALFFVLFLAQWSFTRANGWQKEAIHYDLEAHESFLWSLIMLPTRILLLPIRGIISLWSLGWRVLYAVIAFSASAFIIGSVAFFLFLTSCAVGVSFLYFMCDFCSPSLAAAVAVLFLFGACILHAQKQSFGMTRHKRTAYVYAGTGIYLCTHATCAYTFTL